MGETMKRKLTMLLGFCLSQAALAHQGEHHYYHEESLLDATKDWFMHLFSHSDHLAEWLMLTVAVAAVSLTLGIKRHRAKKMAKVVGSKHDS
jgi:hypothetical protein